LLRWLLVAALVAGCCAGRWSLVSLVAGFADRWSLVAGQYV
jgi:hypothetical protein